MLCQTARAETQLPNGLYAGTFEKTEAVDGASPINYFVESSGQARKLAEVLRSPENKGKVLLASKAFDNIVFIVHPAAVLDGQINQSFASYFGERELSWANDIMKNTVSEFDGCTPLALVVFGNSGKLNIRFGYVYSIDGVSPLLDAEIEECVGRVLDLSK